MKDIICTVCHIIVWIIIILGFLLIVSSCSGTGFNKRATLMPDSVSVNFMQEQYKHDSSAWRGVGVSATWNFK